MLSFIRTLMPSKIPIRSSPEDLVPAATLGMEIGREQTLRELVGAQESYCNAPDIKYISCSAQSSCTGTAPARPKLSGEELSSRLANLRSRAKRPPPLEIDAHHW